MDVGAFVQENKRWLLGCALGGIVFLIGKTIVETVYDPGSVAGQASRIATGASAMELYDQEALKAAREEGEQLSKERQRLQQELSFTPAPRYQLAGQTIGAEAYYLQVGRELKQQIFRRAQMLGVQVADKDLSWPAGGTVDDVRGLLFGLELVDETCKRLFAAHESAQKIDPAGLGLRTLQLRIEDRRQARSVPKNVRPGDVDLREHLEQERLQFTFQSDAVTALLFLEACRQLGKALVVESLTATQGTKPGEPITVKGSLVGIVFKTTNGGS
jgi:hypothetical protein